VNAGRPSQCAGAMFRGQLHCLPAGDPECGLSVCSSLSLDRTEAASPGALAGHLEYRVLEGTLLPFHCMAAGPLCTGWYWVPCRASRRGRRCLPPSCAPVVVTRDIQVWAQLFLQVAVRTQSRVTTRLSFGSTSSPRSPSSSLNCPPDCHLLLFKAASVSGRLILGEAAGTAPSSRGACLPSTPAGLGCFGAVACLFSWILLKSLSFPTLPPKWPAQVCLSLHIPSHLFLSLEASLLYGCSPILTSVLHHRSPCPLSTLAGPLASALLLAYFQCLLSPVGPLLPCPYPALPIFKWR
jgi:hypothetical protein